MLKEKMRMSDVESGGSVSNDTAELVPSPMQAEPKVASKLHLGCSPFTPGGVVTAMT